jgi:hypothetical protein
MASAPPGRTTQRAAERDAVPPPQGLTLEHDRDLKGRERRPHVRHALLGLQCAFLALGLLNLFGQSPVESSATGPGARLEVSSPTKLRGGLFFQARFRITAEREIENATIVLDRGWLEGITLNTLVPAPLGEASRDGHIALELGRVPPGQEHVLYLQFQVNPTAVGRHSQDVQLYDGERLLTSVDRSTTIWP